MRAAAILGLGCTEKDLRPFQRNSDATWLLGMPGDSSDAEAILVFGGDGTIHRHLAQLVRLDLPVLVVPRGSGNDFARALGLRNIRTSMAAWRQFSSRGKNVRTIDLGVIHARPPRAVEPQRLKPPGRAAALSTAEAVPLPEPPHAGHAAAPYAHYFCCVGGVGLDSEVARRANQLPRWLRGHGGYVGSLLPALFRWAPFPMRISLPSGDGFVTHSDKPTVLAAFANAPVYGGGMKIAPQAQLDDGKLDLCVIRDIDKFKLFCLFPTVYFGQHLRMPEVDYLQTDRLRIETEMPLDVYADGEYVCKTPIEVAVARGALRVITL